MKYHINSKGEAKPCKARVRPCPHGTEEQHFETLEAARATYEKWASQDVPPLTKSHGQLVRKGRVGASAFLREVIERRGNDRFDGTLEEVCALARKHLDKAEPGVGSVDGDVVLVPVPPQGFRTDIVEITDENAHMLEEVTEARVEGEAPVTKRILRGVEPQPAKVVKLVLYRADTLARDSGRSTDDEWELVAMLAQPQEVVPMHPTTMERNARHDKGGTYREYSDEEWSEARDFWSRHAYAVKE